MKKNHGCKLFPWKLGKGKFVFIPRNFGRDKQYFAEENI